MAGQHQRAKEGGLVEYDKRWKQQKKAQKKSCIGVASTIIISSTSFLEGGSLFQSSGWRFVSHAL